MPKKLQETVTVAREVTGVIADLVKFARLVHNAPAEKMADDAYVIGRARAYWDQHHGED